MTPTFYPVLPISTLLTFKFSTNPGFTNYKYHLSHAHHLHLPPQNPTMGTLVENSRFLSHHALLTVLFLLSLSFCSFALDMSIIDYDDAVLWRTYEAWLMKHAKAYNALGEKERRFQIFKDNLRFVEEHNNGAGNKEFRLGLNRFADLTNEEYRAMFLGTRKKLTSKKTGRYAFRAGDELPSMVDWREKGAVAPVKDQGQCGEFC